MQSWENRCFIQRVDGLTAAALDAAWLSRDAGSERRADDYLSLDDDHGFKRRGGAPARGKVEVKTCLRRTSEGTELLARSVLVRDGDGWRDERGPVEPSLAGALDGGAWMRVAKERWNACGEGGVVREVTELSLLSGENWLSLCCEGDDEAAVTAAGAALQRAVLDAAHLPHDAAHVCSYAAWVRKRLRGHAAEAQYRTE